ncbi:activated protein kinase kinase kinase 7 [Seminavis robusta]|uniref:Activated protein kinase kinase kinase 7 n=1 Tax=Seminavis robusta TaxID=568900 RepID=A0A9N8ECY0_9STRA|nr:activated protein kinase kinase kinase 7 [Seminavis robusta]|eukprot:Sro818_g206960.1 activated protein kinase kinase kinase 7 (648) ;mRNA; f:27097-29309
MAPQIPFPKRSPSNGDIGSHWWQRVVVQRSAYAVDALVETMTERSNFLREAYPPAGYAPSLAVVNRDEVRVGALLGQGTYSDVFEVAGLELSDSDDDDEDTMTGLEANINSIARAARQSLQAKARDDKGRCQYAIKHLKPDLLKDSKSFESAAADLIMEAKWLSIVNHPNIVKMHGIAMGGTAAYACSGLYDSFFVIVDKIHETLYDRLKTWRQQSATHLCNPTNTTLMLKMDIALQLGDALSYLHERRLVFRDLKPHNCGLTKDGKVLLFDFGFCRELPDIDPDIPEYIGGTLVWGEEDAQQGDDARLYGMSGKGTLMYMSPETLGTRRYNQKADVYGWSIILYEMLTLRRPYAIESVEGHRRTIFRRGERPPLGGSGIPRTLQHLLENSWDACIARRYTMQEAVLHLEHVLAYLSTPGYHSPQVGSIENCIASSCRFLWSPVEGLLNTLARDAPTTGGVHLKQEQESEPQEDAAEEGKPQPVGTETEPIRAFSTMPTESTSTGFSVSSLSIRVESACLNKIEHKGYESKKLESTVAAADDQIEIEIVMEQTKSDLRIVETATSMAECSAGTNVRTRRNRHRQAPRGHHGTFLYHSYYGHVPRGKKGTAGDNRYKDRLLRTIHSVHGTIPRTPSSIPRKQVVSPSA